MSFIFFLLGDVPRGYGIEAFHNAKKLGVPDLGTVPDFANYEPILMIVESFLQKVKSKSDFFLL